MLNERETLIVRKCRGSSFSTYLTWAYLEYPFLLDEIGKGDYPQQKMRYANRRMTIQKTEFDNLYLHLLPELSPTPEQNPLRLEQEAWGLLSPVVQQHTDDFGRYLDAYSPANARKQELLGHVNQGWTLIQDWNIISWSYKTKEQGLWDELETREQAARGLIQRLSMNPTALRHAEPGQR